MDLCMYFIILLLKDLDPVIAFVQPAARQIECLLWPGFPITAEVMAVDKDNAFSPVLHVQKAVPHFPKFKIALIACRIAGHCPTGIGQFGETVHGQSVHLPVAGDLPVINGYRADDAFQVMYDFCPIVDAAHIFHAGWATPKYNAIRSVMQKYVHYDIPKLPAQIPVIAIAPIRLSQSANLFDLLRQMQPVENDTPMSFEDLNQGYGYVVYQKKFQQPVRGKLKIEGLRDYAMVYVNGKQAGELNRYFKHYSMDIDIPFNATLTIVVENMGRINYGAEIVHNLKGIIRPAFQ